MPTPEEVAQICAEVHEFRNVLHQQQEICADLDQHPDLILFALISTMKKQNRNQRFFTLCALWVALSAMLIAIVPTLSSQNYFLILLVILLALVPTTVAAKSIENIL